MYVQQAKNRWEQCNYIQQSHGRLFSEEDYVHELVIPAKRARTVSIGSSQSCSGIWQAIIKRQISDGCWGGEGGIVMPMAT